MRSLVFNVLTKYKQCPLLVSLTCIAFFIWWTGLLTIQTIEHDDWPFLVEKWDHYWTVTLQTGRWLTYLWSRVTNYVLTPTMAPALFWAAYLGLGVSFIFAVQGAHNLRFCLFALLVLCANNAAISLAGWPTTTLIAAATAAVGACLIVISRTQRTRMLFLFVFSALAFQSYPAFSFVLLLITLAAEKRLSAREVIVIASIVPSAIVVSTLISFAINLLNHGIFGIVHSDWRQPRYATDLPTLTANIELFLWRLSLLVEDNALLVLLAACGQIYSIATSEEWDVRPLFALAVPLGFDAALTVHSGIINPGRAQIWLAFLVVFVTRDLLEKIPINLVFPAIGILALAGNALATGAVARTQRSLAIVEEAHALAVRTGVGTVLILGTYTTEKGRAAGQLRYRGLDVRICAWGQGCGETLPAPPGVSYAASVAAVLVNSRPDGG